MNQCEYCKKIYNNKYTLEKHQRTTKRCLEIQQKLNDQVEIINFSCEFCNKTFTSKQTQIKHNLICPKKFEYEISKLKQILSELTDKLSESNENILRLETENNLLREQQLMETDNNNELLEKLQEIAMTAIDQKNEVISGMVKKYVKKQPRKKFDCSNVVYILTTQSLKKDRRYILGKAKNLTNRLSTYNKTDEHEVVYYKDCGDEETMNILELFVFKKLSKYREQANRERFILPDNNKIDLFINTINECFEFLK